MLDLSKAEKLDRFVHALVQGIRLQVELRGLANFHEAAQFAECANAVITRVAGHNAQKAAPQKTKWGYSQRSPVPIKTSGESSVHGSGGPEPMELGTVSRQSLMRAEYEKLRAEKACFVCRKPGHLARNCPMKKKNSGNGMGR